MDVTAVDGYIEAITSVVNVCVDYYEREVYVLPQEKYALLRALAFGVSMIDGNDEKTSILKNKRIKLDKVFKIIKVWEFSFSLKLK